MNVTSRISGVRRHGLCAVLVALLLRGLDVLAQGAIVYRDIEDVSLFGVPGGGTVFYDLDLDQNGSADFTFRSTTHQFDCVPQSNNRILSIPAGTPDLRSDVIPLTVGEEISPMPNDPYAWNASLTLASGINIGSVFTCCINTRFGLVCLGLFTGQNAYMGVEFEIDGELHYGWVGVDCSIAGVNGGWVTEYAYQTRPGVAIKAGAKLVVVPTAAPEVARPGYLRLNWPSELGKAYQVQTRTRMDALRWMNLSFVIPATATDTMVDVPMVGAAQFFRVIEAD